MFLSRHILFCLCLLAGCAGTQKENSSPSSENVQQLKKGEDLIEQGKYQQAATLFEQLLVQEPENARVHYYLGLAKKRLGDRAAAEKHYRLAIEREPELLPAHNNLGLLLLEKGDLEQARTELGTYLANRQDDSAAHFNYGLVLEEMGRTEEAAYHYQTAAALDPKDPSPQIGLGDLALYKKAHANALAHYRKARTLAPDLLEVLVKEGQALLALGRIEEATEVLSPLTANTDAGPELLVITGILLAQAGAEDLAVEHYRAALRADEKSARAHLLLANALARQGQFADAADHYTKVLSLVGETAEAPEIRKRLAICKSKMK